MSQVVLKAIDLSLSYGDKTLLDSVCFDLHEGEVAALVGPNGSGKTSLLRLLAGLETPDGGRVVVFRRGLPASELKAGYLPQNVRDQSSFLSCGGVRLVASDYVVRNLSELSGGQKTRTLLAGLLARDPDLLLLDEPTNHLDLETMLWLEEFLLGCGRPALVVSHDRRFLDRVASRVVELKRGQVKEYPGGYSDYKSLSESESRHHQETWLKQERRRKHLACAAERQMRWADRAHKAAGQNDALRRLAKKGHKRAKATARRLERLIDEGVDKPWIEDRIKVDLRGSGRTGGSVVTLHDVTTGYGSEAVLHRLDLCVTAGDCLAVVGPSGVGKTTLLRLMAGELEAAGGDVYVSPGLRIGYFRQELDDLDPAASPFSMVVEASQGRPSGTLNRSEARTYLGTLLFRGDDVFRPVGELSVGERVRLSLGCLFLREPDLLLLDEPTNHLDIPSRETVETALENYGGTTVLISHDRFFLDRVATRVLDLERPGAPVVYPGNYSYYVWKRAGGEN